MTLQKLIQKYNDLQHRELFQSKPSKELYEDFVKPFAEDFLGWKDEDFKWYDIKYSAEVHENLEFFVLNGSQQNRDKLLENTMASTADVHVLTNFAVLDIYYKDKKIAGYGVEEYEKKSSELRGILSKRALESGDYEVNLEELTRTDVDEHLLNTLRNLRREVAADLLSHGANEPYVKTGGEIDEEKLNAVVQRILDRLLIYRFAEDNGLVKGNPLTKLYFRYKDRTGKALKGVHEGVGAERDVWSDIQSKFQLFQEDYDGRIFDDTDEIKAYQVELSREVVLELLDKLVHHRFEERKLQILGSTYEKYLGYKLYVEHGEAVLRETPEARRAGGIYYTPSYITEYIAENTLGDILEEKRETLEKCIEEADKERFVQTVRDAKELKILDPACGSGAFLAQALRLMREFYHDYSRKDGYRDRMVEALKDSAVEGKDEVREGQTQAGFTEVEKFNLNEKIPAPGVYALRHNIYGVDLDAKAAEVAAVSLMIQVMDDVKNVEDVKFPSILEENIKTGNSLISGIESDDDLEPFRDKIDELTELRKQLLETDDEGEKTRLHDKIDDIKTPINQHLNSSLKNHFDDPEEKHPFNWQTEFPEVFNRDNAGFDVVIGNPPYYHVSNLEDNTRSYIKDDYNEVYRGDSNILYYFLNIAPQTANKEGKIGYILERYYIESQYADKLRKWMYEDCRILRLIDFGTFEIFEDAGTLTNILIFTPNQNDAYTFNIRKLINDEIPSEKLANSLLADSNNVFKSFDLSSDILSNRSWNLFEEKTSEIKEKMEKGAIKLGDILEIGMSMSTGLNSVFVLSGDTAKRKEINEDLLKPLVKNGDVRRYYIRDRDEYVLWTENIDEVKKHPKVFKYLADYKDQLKERHAVKEEGKEWWKISVPRNEKLFQSSSSRILAPYQATYNRFAIDRNKRFSSSADIAGLFLIEDKDQKNYEERSLVALLNSKASEFYHKNTAKVKRGGWYEYFENDLKNIPIPDKGDTKISEILNKGSKFLERFAGSSVNEVLVHLADEMMDLKESKYSVETDFETYLEDFDSDGPKLSDVAEVEFTDLLADATAEDYDRLKFSASGISTSSTELEDGKRGVTVTAGVKWATGEKKDSSGRSKYEYEETEVEFAKIVAEEPWASLIEFYLPTMPMTRTATKNISLGDRLAGKKKGVKLPDIPEEELQEIVDQYRGNVERAEELDEKIRKTDDLIDQIVYRLYGLTEEEIEVVEREVGR